MNHWIIAVIVLIAGFNLKIPVARAYETLGETPSQFVERALKDYETTPKDSSGKLDLDESKRLLQTYFDLDYIATHAVGVKATARLGNQKVREYCTWIKETLLPSYVSQLETKLRENGYTLKGNVVNPNPYKQGKTLSVKIILYNNSGTPLSFFVLVQQRGTEYKIIDVSVDNALSLSQKLRFDIEDAIGNL